MTDKKSSICRPGQMGSGLLPHWVLGRGIGWPLAHTVRRPIRKGSMRRWHASALRQRGEITVVPQTRKCRGWLAATVLCAGLLSADAVQAQAAAAETRERLQQCQQQETACRQEVEELRRDAADLQRCQADLQVCKAKLAKTFLAIVIQWPTRSHDVDLHIIDPGGKQFYYEKKKFPRPYPGELSVDTTCGPGVEIWEVADAPAGEYKVYYNLFDRHRNAKPAVVKGGAYHRDGHDRFRERRLTTPGKGQLVATVTVKDDGSVEVSERSGNDLEPAPEQGDNKDC